MRRYEDLDELQQLAIDDLYAHDERLALLETGFGKTVCELTVGEELMAAGVVTTPLVFAPLRVAQATWPNEPANWEHLQNVKMVCWGGAPEDWADSIWKQSRILYGKRLWLEQRMPKIVDVRKRREAEAKLAAIVSEERAVNRELLRTPPTPGYWHVTSFENTEWLLGLFKPGELPFDMVVVDETGRVARNPKSPRYKLMAKHIPRVKVRHGLNATPAPEGCEDLFGQVQLVCGPKLWSKSFYQWRMKYFTPADYQGYTWRLQLGAFDLLMADLNKVAFRAPATAYTKNATTREIEVTLPPKARAAYAEMEKTMAVGLEAIFAERTERTKHTDESETNEELIVAMSEAAASQKLRQIVQGYLYETDETGRRVVHHLHDEKANALSDLIDSMGREPLMVCYQFDEDLEIIRRIWKNVPFLGQGVSASAATDTIERWNKREVPVMAAHPACLHPDTLVLTEHVGWKRLIDVRADERVFDGTEFVTHKGCQLSGVRPVIERFGIVMTPDHLILVDDEWVKAADVRDTGSARRAARYHHAGIEGCAGALRTLRIDERTTPTKCLTKQQNKARALPGLHSGNTALSDPQSGLPNLVRHDREGDLAEFEKLQTLWWARHNSGPGMAGLSELLARHGANLRRWFDNRTDRRERALLERELLLGYEHGSAGQQAHDQADPIQRASHALGRVLSGDWSRSRSDNELPRPDGGRERRPSVGNVPTVHVSEEPKEPQEVYDLVDCGPRHRFVVRNAAGEMFIVHNSMSHGVNLQYGGHHVAWLALPWSLDAYKQSVERLDRRGQTKPVYSHHILARDTIDQKVSAALVEKDEAQNKLIAAIRKIG